MLNRIIFFISFLVFFIISTSLSVNGQTPQPENRIRWQGIDWYVHGVNVPWYNWGCDFGCNTGNGVVKNKTAIGIEFAKLKDANAHVVRWWIFPGDPWQINRDTGGAPTTLNTAAIYPDFDAALDLAEQYDLYYNFVIFSAADSMPSTWRTNATQRQKVGQALAPLFQKYRNHPRILSWELFNEPEWQIWRTPGVTEADVKAMAREIISVIRVNSPETLITVGQALIEGYGPTEPGITMWKDVDLDYYSPHWYDIHTNNQCLLCFTYAQLKTKYGINKPIVGGEVHMATEINPLNRYNEFYNKGYAGAWGWSLFWDHTGDQLQIDMNALKTFGLSKTDIGPKAQTGTPTPTTVNSPTPTRTPTPGIASLTPTSARKQGDCQPPTGDNDVDIFDYNSLVSNFGSTTNLSCDFVNLGAIDIFDYNIVVSNFGI